MTAPVRIIGSLVSPYVRKVLVSCELKGIGYQVDPIVPFLGNDRFGELSPLRRIPVLQDGELTLADSSVICQYLEDRWPEPPLYPSAPAAAARARWFEEYADSRMGDVFIWRLFNEAVINPGLWGKPRDLDELQRIVADDVPQVMDYLEGELPSDRFLFGEVSIADISIAAFFRNAAWARFRPEPERWPKTAAFVARVFDLPAFRRLEPFEELQIRTPVPEQRRKLAEAGFPVTEETLAGNRLRRGPTIV